MSNTITRSLVLLGALAASAASAETPAPAPDAAVQARCAAEGGCILITRTRLQQELERVLREAQDAAAKTCRRTDA